MIQDKNQALEVIEQAIDVATRKGAYSLGDVNNVLQALSILRQPDTPKEKDEKL